MNEEVKNFLTSIAQNSDFHAMKLLLEVFIRMQASDDISKSIVENLASFNFCDISLIDLKSLENYVYTADDLSKSSIYLSTYATSMSATHEFGHLLLDLFSDGKLPQSYFRVNKKIKQNLTTHKKDIIKRLSAYRDYLFSILLKSVELLRKYTSIFPDIEKKYKSENPNITNDELDNNIVADIFFYLVGFDLKAKNINVLGNILDSSFHGRNPFFKFYGNEVFHPLISAHDPKYYLEGDEEKHFVGFQEQFAEYLVIRLFPEEMQETKKILYEYFKEDWFKMMDQYYEMIACKIKEKTLNANNKR